MSHTKHYIDNNLLRFTDVIEMQHINNLKNLEWQYYEQHQAETSGQVETNRRG